MSHQQSFDPFRPGGLTRFRAENRTRFVLSCEALESRHLLSTTASSTPNLSQITAQTQVQVLPQAIAGPSGLNPLLLRSAYGVSQISVPNGAAFIYGYGTGQTIAIVTAYNDPRIISDLAAFDRTYGLPDAPAVNVLNMGATTTDPGWALETSLDVEYAHTIAPSATIDLVEASSASFNSLFNAVNFAKNLPNVSVVSMSWGTSEFYGEAAYDSLFTTPAGHTGVTFVAASGDSGAWSGPSYPAISPNVIGVGGTTLNLTSSGTYGSETGWTYSTGGFSGLATNWTSYEAQPAYQTATLTAAGLSYGVRTSPDVSFNADPNTGVPVYDSIPYSGQSGWFQVGGTSAATPAWAGLIAIANEGLSLAGKGTLSNTQALTDLYSLPSSDFHDITSGFNGYYASTGYDLVTGLGSPKANLVISGILTANGVSVASATTQPTTSTTIHATTTRLDVVSSSTFSSSIAGLTNNGLAGSSATLTTFGMQAIVTQNSPTPTQPLAQQTAVVAPLSQTAATSPSLGQSLTQSSQNGSTIRTTDETTAPTPLDEDTAEAPAPAAVQPSTPAAEPSTAPAPEQTPMPAEEAPVVSPAAPASDETVDDPATSLREETFTEVDPSVAARNLEQPLGPDRESEQASEPLSDRSLAALAGAAVVAVGGYRVLIGRSDRIKRRWNPGRFF